MHKKWSFPLRISPVNVTKSAGMWPNPQFPADLVTFTVEILDGKLHFLCSGKCTKDVKRLFQKKKKKKKKFANMSDHVCTNFFYKRNVYDDLETNSSISFQYSEGASCRQGSKQLIFNIKSTSFQFHSRKLLKWSVPSQQIYSRRN